jgi:dTDP-4-amino-4,6-dideoxygalactose transaminase
VRGEEVERFENEFAELMGVEHCVSCANGTDAIFITMKCLGLKYGDEVIVPANSWISASESVSLAGGVPVFCDIDPITYTLNPTEILKKITSKIFKNNFIKNENFNFYLTKKSKLEEDLLQTENV